MGHEFVGVVKDTCSAVTTVRTGLAVSMNRSQNMPQMTVQTADGSASKSADSPAGVEHPTCNQV
jgi:threonine dehydrogenase-like Zn-dependent dehydrogenase